MRSGNPTLNEKTFIDVPPVASSQAMTINGTVNRTAILLGLVLIPACYVWNQFFASAGQAPVGVYIGIGAIGGLVLAMVTIFKKTWAPITAPMYAVFEGLFLGAISATMEARFPGIVIQAVGLTFGTLFGLLFAYKSGFIRATENFKLGVVAATGGIFLVYMVSFVMSFFGTRIPFIHESGLIGIGFSAFVVVIAAMNLVLDFDFIENGAERGAPKYMEWFAAFGLMVTLIWLYIEILHLLAKLRGRR
ncbi:MAG: Bax inhibitor-1/YccA family protein [Elusimicrobiota bacterium]